LGIWFQSQEQTRASRDAQEQRRLAAEENKEETLQRYLDRVSQLLIEKDLIRQSNVQINPIVVSASGVIRARTLSVLRSFTQDGKRKGSVVLFLIETEVLLKLKVSLADSQLAGAKLAAADLSEADLAGADLTGAYLKYANLSKADLGAAHLSFANLTDANLSEANLRGANLVGANLSGALLSGANLSGAHLSRANLSGALLMGTNLSFANLTEANLSGAKLRGVNLREAIFKETICPDGKKTDTGCPVPEGIQ